MMVLLSGREEWECIYVNEYPHKEGLTNMRVCVYVQ